MPESERKLRTARHYLHHALLLVDEALGNAPAPEPGSLDALRIERNGPPERVPKWDPAWGKAPNCDGLSARDIRSPHPMQAEAIRDHDERLQGPEDAL
jgi:hypothetical protein